MGRTSNVSPLHMVEDISGSIAERFTKTSTEKGMPIQFPTAGVTVYVAVAGAFVVLVKFWVITDNGVA